MRCTSLGGEAAYAISRGGGFSYLQKKGFHENSKHILGEYITAKRIGEIDSNKESLKSGYEEQRIKKAKSRKLRALVLSRSSVDWKLWKKFDKGMQNWSCKSVYTDKQCMCICVCVYISIPGEQKRKQLLLTMSLKNTLNILIVPDLTM